MTLTLLAMAFSGHVANVNAVDLNLPSSGANHPPSKGMTGKTAEVSSHMRSGVITTVDSTGEKVEIDRQWYSIVGGKTQVFQRGKSVRTDVLKPGQAIKFTVTQSGSEGKKLGAVYVP
jgi:hypothetical protein